MTKRLTLRKEYLLKSQRLTVRKDAVQHTAGVVLDDFYVFGYPELLVYIVHAENDKYLIEKQYRHGISCVYF